MPMKRFSHVFSLLLLLSAFTNLSAHHSSAPHFDKDLEVNVQGTITKLKLVNPHAYLYFDEEKDGKVVSWRCELSSATQLRRFGWTAELLAVGQQVTVVGSPARREDNVCFLSTLTLADGRTLERNTDLTKVQSSAIASQQPAKRPLTLENGQPNLQGPWVTKSFGRNAEGIRPEFIASEAGKAAVGGYTMAFDDPILGCHIVNIFNGWNHDENVNDIIQNDQYITLQYGFMDYVRTVHLGMTQHPDNITPSAGGHSIGHWEGNTLVVDTIGFEAGVLNHRNGMKHSDQMHAVERFSYDPERQYLVREYTVNDPLYLIGTTKGEDYMALSNEPYSAYNCVELSGKNNIRPE